MAILATQAAIAAGVTLKAGPDAIKPIPAVEYPLPAARPTNSRMDTAKLCKALESIGDMSKLQYCKHLWSDEVKSYVAQLAQNGII